uniref:Transcription elongation factor 1 homolog n=1 Tax=Oryza glumipatula TaxID=40148 RepID=A0A0D9YLY7_9ORYZ
MGRNTSPYACTDHNCGLIRTRHSWAQGPRSNGPPILLAAASINQAVRVAVGSVAIILDSGFVLRFASVSVSAARRELRAKGGKNKR